MTALVLALVSCALTKALVFEGVSLGDICFVVAVAICLRSRRAPPQDASARLIKTLVYSLIGWALLGALWSPVWGGAGSLEQALKSFAKLLLYSGGATVLYRHIRTLSLTCVYDAVRMVCLGTSLIALYVLVAQLSGAPERYYLFLWFGQAAPLQLGDPMTLRYVSELQMATARGNFSEPSMFAIFQCWCVALLLTLGRQTKRTSIVVALAIVLTILSLSVSGLGLLLAIVCTVRFPAIAQARRWVLTAVLAGCGIVGVVGMVSPIPLKAWFQDGIWLRAVSIFEGSDNSANGRLLGSWDVATSVLASSPLTGSGIGNLDATYARLSGHDLSHGLDRYRAPVHVVPFYVLASLGVVGLFLFGWLILLLLKADWGLGAVFVVSLFCAGTFLEPGMWVMLAAYLAAAHLARPVPAAFARPGAARRTDRSGPLPLKPLPST